MIIKVKIVQKLLLLCKDDLLLSKSHMIDQFESFIAKAKMWLVSCFHTLTNQPLTTTIILQLITASGAPQFASKIFLINQSLSGTIYKICRNQFLYIQSLSKTKSQSKLVQQSGTSFPLHGYHKLLWMLTNLFTQ